MGNEKIMNAARVIVEDCLGLKKGEKILLLTDDGISCGRGVPELRDDLIEIMNEKDLDPCVLSYQARTKKGAEIPELAEAACMDADVIIGLTTYSFLHSSAFPRIHEPGSARRIVLLPAAVCVGDSDYLERMMPQTDEEFYRIKSVTDKYGNMLADGNEHTVHLTAENGTDLTLKLGELTGAIQDGLCTEPGCGAVMPGGSLALGVNEGSAEGTLVIDYMMSVEKEQLKNKVCFEVHNGYATSITGGEEAERFISAAEEQPYSAQEKFNIAEFGLGFNPKAKAEGFYEDGEDILGGAHIGIGSDISFGGKVFIPAWHIDCIIPKASMEVDGVSVLDNGEYIV